MHKPGRITNPDCICSRVEIIEHRMCYYKVLIKKKKALGKSSDKVA